MEQRRNLRVLLPRLSHHQNEVRCSVIATTTVSMPFLWNLLTKYVRSEKAEEDQVFCNLEHHFVSIGVTCPLLLSFLQSKG